MDGRIEEKHKIARKKKMKNEGIKEWMEKEEDKKGKK